MKQFLLIPSFLLLAALAPNQHNILKSIVKITHSSTNICTGFVVSASQGHVLTAEHCVPQDANVELSVDDKPGRVIKKSGTLALVAYEPFLKPPVTIRKDDIKVGEAVQTFGYGLGFMHQFGRQVAAWFESDIILDGGLLPGMSGGPIVDDGGKVVGINQGTASTGVAAIGCSAREIRDFLDAK